MKIYKVSFTFSEDRATVINKKLKNMLNDSEWATTMFDVKDVQEETITEPDLPYKREDFENDEEYGKYKEAVYFAKIGAKVTKTDSTVYKGNVGDPNK